VRKNELIQIGEQKIDRRKPKKLIILIKIIQNDVLIKKITKSMIFRYIIE